MPLVFPLVPPFSSFGFGSYADVEAFLKAEAAETTKAYPQYRGKFESYRLGRVRKAIRTKMGEAAYEGELVIFRIERDEGARILRGIEQNCVVFWSRANKVDTVVRLGDVVAVETTKKGAA